MALGTAPIWRSPRGSISGVCWRDDPRPDRQYTHLYVGGADEANFTFTPTAGNPYYINGSLAALTVPKEYYYDSAASKLYLQAPGSANPSSSGCRGPQTASTASISAASPTSRCKGSA